MWQQTLFSKATYKLQATVDQEEASENKCLEIQFHVPPDTRLQVLEEKIFFHF